MRWYNGSIVEAVNLSKSKNAYFVVYIEGTDDKSKKMTEVVNQPDISSRLEQGDKFVAIKVTSDSEAYKQFSQIYKLVPVPSLFFIGNNGVPAEIIGDKENLATSLVVTIDKLIAQKGGSDDKPSGSASSNKAAASSFIDAERESTSQASSVPVAAPNNDKTESPNTDDGYKVICENGVCRRVKIEPEAPKESEASSSNVVVTPVVADIPKDESVPQVSMEDKIQRAKELLEKKRLQKLEEEKEEEKKRELERRSQGQSVAELKKWQQEQELKNLKEERLKEKRANEEARARILKQIAQDRADKLAKSSSPTSDAPKPIVDPEPTAARAVDTNVTRIQFKMPDGGTHTTQISSDDTLGDLRQYVRQNIQTSGSFSLSTMYPRQRLDEDKDSESMRSLGLSPSSALLLLRDGASSSSRSSAPVANNDGFIAMITQVFWALVVQPAQGLWVWISNFFTGNRGGRPNATGSVTPQTPNTSRDEKRFGTDSKSNEAKRRRVSPPSQGGGGTTSIRRDGNTFRLKDNDSDDENNTWNGNSTQQM